ILLYVYHRHGTQWHFTHSTKGQFSQALPTPVMRVNNATGMLPALRAGLGLSLMPEFLVADDLRTGSLQPVMTDWVLEDTALHIVTPPGRRRPARVNAFIDFLMQALAKQPWRTS
ncbi:MAG TPA: LysR substrate-binding domain-containing protein, partial [Paenalcaligenes sp.]|nr:LysR substrate-binding domain-containing protein [Paenalcaligenes sp.]